MPHNIPARKQLHFALLHRHIVDALHEQKDYDTALAIAALLDAGRFEVIAEFSRYDDGDYDPLSLHYRVELALPDGTWTPLVRVHHSRVAVTDDEARMELAAVMAQHGIGIPDDVSELDDGAA